MSHLKEPVVINFTAKDPLNNEYVLIFNAPFLFTFNENFLGSYGWIHSDDYPTADVTYTIRNENTNSFIGSFIIYTTGMIEFFTVDESSKFIPADTVLTISSTATQSIGTFGISLVGER